VLCYSKYGRGVYLEDVSPAGDELGRLEEPEEDEDDEEDQHLHTCTGNKTCFVF